MKITLIVLGILGTVFLAEQVGFLSQPWALWWIGQQQGSLVTLPLDSPLSNSSFSTEGNGGDSAATVPVAPDSLPASGATHVTDDERYALITAAGAQPSVAIIMTAISIAEDGSGDPAIVSKPNTGLAAGTVDIGLWQVNSAHIGECGITSRQWLFDPMNNALAAMCVLGPHLNYCAWSTYEASCGAGHNSAYVAFLPCARAIAEGGTCRR